MKVKEFCNRWNKDHQREVHFYVDELDGDITGVKIRFPASRYKLSPMQMAALENIVLNKSLQSMIVSSSQNCIRNGVIDLVANPCRGKLPDYDQVAMETLKHLAEKVFPSFSEGGRAR